MRSGRSASASRIGTTPTRSCLRGGGASSLIEHDTASCLNANDQRKVFGANQERTMVGVLRTVHSEYGKEIRKDYESGNLDISRHEFLEHEIREDGVANTIDSVTKDNLLGIGIEGNYMPSGHSAGNIISQGGGIADSYGESRNGQRGHGPRQRSNKARVRRCEGGAGQYQPLNAGIENKKRSSRGRYGKHS